MSYQLALRPALVVAVLCGAGASGASTQASLPPSLELRVPKAPTLGTAEGGSFLAYELHVTTFSDGKSVPFTLPDSALTQVVSRPGLTIKATDRTKIAGKSLVRLP